MKNIMPLIEECRICLENHKVKDCFILKSPSIISDTLTLCKAYASLPPVLSIEKTHDGKEVVKSKSFLSKGTRFGPVDSKTIDHVPCDSEFPLKMTLETNQWKYLDTTDKTVCNWMCLVQPADSFQDCNLVAYQSEFCIYFSVLRDIVTHSELKVYYAPLYAEKMGVQFIKSIQLTSIKNYNDLMFDDIGSPNEPLGPEDMMERVDEIPGSPYPVMSQIKRTSTLDVSKLSAKSLGAPKGKQEWKCSMCGDVFQSVPDFANHLRGHYTSANKSKDKSLLVTNTNENVMPNPDALLSLSGVFNVNCEPDSLISSTTVPTSLNLGDELHVMSDLNLAYINLIPSGSLLYLDPTHKTIGESGSKPKPPVKQMLACEICGKKFDKACNILRHLKKHSGEFYCGVCGKVFARKETLQVHECVNLVYTCDLCRLTFTHVKLFRQHRTEHLRSTGKYTLESLSCNQCSHQSATITSFIEHIRSHNTNGITLDNVKCPICGQSYARPRIFYKTHLRTHEGNVYCHQCKGVFLGPKTYEKHGCFHKSSSSLESQTKVKLKTKMFRRPAARSPEPDSSSRLTCDICLAHFNQEAELQVHKSQHEEANTTRSIPVLCDHCGKSYDSVTSLKKHIYKMHINRKISCKEPSCQKQFDSQDKLLLHVQRHQDGRGSHSSADSYPCTYCSKVFGMKRYRARHIVIKHGSDFKHECSVCDKKFKDKTYLNSHVRKAHSDTPRQRPTYRYSCHLCKRSFVKKSSLRQHIESHSVVVSYACTFCPKVTVRAKRMLRHLASVHDDKKPEWNNEAFFNQLRVVKDLSETTSSANEPQQDSSQDCAQQTVNDHQGLLNSEDYGEQNENNHNLMYQNEARQMQAYQHTGYQDHMNDMDHEDNLLTEDPMKLFDLHTESNSNAAILKGRELPVDSITNFDLSVFYNDQSEEMPCVSLCPPAPTVPSVCPPVVKEGNLLQVTAPATNQVCLSNSITLPSQTMQISDSLVAPLYGTLSVSESGEFVNGESLLYVILDPSSSLTGSAGTNVQVTSNSLDCSSGTIVQVTSNSLDCSSGTNVQVTSNSLDCSSGTSVQVTSNNPCEQLKDLT